MDLISFSEMDIRNMKRRELQALCKKHKIAANLTNLEMADKLASLLKEQEKPVAKGKSCLKTAAEQALENLSDVQRFSKKVRFSPENETFEFSPSAIKPEEIGRRASARKRNMSRQVEGIQGIISEKNEENVNYSEEILNKPVRVIRSRAKKTVNEIENVVETKSAKRVLRSVVSENVSKVQTRVSTRRSSEIEKAENKKEELERDALLRNNNNKISSRKRGIKYDEVLEAETKELNDVVVLKKIELQIILRSPPVKYSHRIKENKALVKEMDVVSEQVARQSKRNKKLIEDLGEIEVVGKERTKRKWGQKLENTNVIDAASKTNDELEVVLQIEEPSRRSSRIGNTRQSIIPQNEKNITAGFNNENENNTLVQSTIVEDDARSKRNPSRRKSVAVSDALPVENEIKNKRRNLRKDTVLEKENAVIEDLSLVEEPPRRSRRTGNRELSILPQSWNTIKNGSEDNKENNTLVQSTAFEGNARPKSSSRRKSVAVSEALPVENDLKINVRNRRKNMMLEKENVVIEGSPLAEEPPKRSSRNSNKRQLNERTGVVGTKGENKKDLSKSSAVEENAKPRRKYYTRKSFVPSDTTLAENVRNNMPIMKQKNPVLEEKNAVVEGSSFAHNRKFVENSAEAHKALVTFGNAAPMRLIVDSDNSHVRNNSEVFSHNPKQKSTNLHGKSQGEEEDFEKTDELKKLNSPKGIGIMETDSDSGKLQNYREEKEGSIGISGFEVVLSINTEDEAVTEEVFKDSMKLQNNHKETESSTGVTGISGFEVVLNNKNENRADKDKDLKDFDSNILAPESEGFVLAEAAVGENDSRLDQSESSAKLAENLDLDTELEVNRNNESETQASGSLKSLNNNEETPGMRDISGFEIVLNIDTEAEVDKDKLSQNCAANEDNSESDNLTQLESDPIPPNASLEEEESYSRSGKQDCIAKLAQNMDLENQLGIDEENIEIQAPNTSKFQDNKEFGGLNANSGFDMVSDIDSQTQLNDHLLEEAKLDENFPLDEFKMNENNESGKHTESISGMSGDVVDFGNSYASEEKHSVESDFLFENYFEEKNTPREVKSMERCGVDEDENLEHNLQGYLSQQKSPNNMEDHFTISSEAIHTSDGNEMTSTKMVDRESDKAENLVVIEPEVGEELANKFDTEAYFEQDNISAIKENFFAVHEREGETSFPDTPDHNRFTTYKVEEIKKDEISASDLECTNSKSMVLMVKGETSRDNDSSLKEQNHSITEATPISLFNRFESLMMVNGTPASEFGNVHADSILQEKHVPLAFSTDEPLNENYVGENRNSPLPSEDNTYKCSSVLCVDKELENPELSVSAENLKRRNQSFGSDCSPEPEESEGIENEFNADFNTLSPEKETQPFEATSPKTNIGLAENQDCKEDEFEVKERAVNAMENYVSDETFEMSQNLTKRADEADENQNHDKSNEYTENQNIRQVSQCWSPDPQYGNSQVSRDSNIYSSWELNVISEHEATKSTSMASKVPFTEEDDSFIAFEKQLGKQSHSVERIILQESFSGDEIAKEFEEAKDLNDFTCFEGDVIETVPISETSRDVTFTGVSNMERSKDNIFIDEENFAGAGVDAMMVEEIKKIDVFVNENSGLERTENDCSQVGGNIVEKVVEAWLCEAAKVLDFVIEDKSSECADQVNHCVVATDVVIEKNPLDKSEELNSLSMTLDNVAAGFEEPFGTEGEFVEATETEDALMKDRSFDNTVQRSHFFDFATEGMDGNLELVDVEIASGIDEKGEATAVETSSMKLKMEKISSLIKGTPKKFETPLYMKENATAVKRVNLGSVTAKSTAKRRALTELHK